MEWQRRRETICVTTILEECLKGGVGWLISCGATPSHPGAGQNNLSDWRQQLQKNGAVVRVHRDVQMFVQNYSYIPNKISGKYVH